MKPIRQSFQISEIDLHDALLQDIAVLYQEKRIVISLILPQFPPIRNAEQAAALIMENTSHFAISFEEPWGQGTYIFSEEIRKSPNGQLHLTITLNSGDTIRIIGTKISLENLPQWSWCSKRNCSINDIINNYRNKIIIYDNIYLFFNHTAKDFIFACQQNNIPIQALEAFLYRERRFSPPCTEGRAAERTWRLYAATQMIEMDRRCPYSHPLTRCFASRRARMPSTMLSAI